MGFEFPPTARRRLVWFTWSALRSLGNSPSVSLSVVFPFVGYWILFSDFASQYLSMSSLDSPPADSSFLGWLSQSRLYFLYFGLLFLGIGSFIYQVRCPYIIKKHADWSDYVIGDGAAMSSRHVTSLGHVLGVIETTAPTPDLDTTRVLFMQRWFAEESYKHTLPRLAVAMCFYVGLTLIAIPSAVSALKIAKLFINLT